jgi:hypothetical protein
MSWTNLMKIRLIEIGLFAGASIGLSYYVGGVGLATFFFSALFLWLVFTAYDVFPATSRYLASLVISAVIPVFTVVALVPQLGKVEWLRSISFRPPSTLPTDYISISSDTLGTTKPWILFVIIGLFLCLMAMLIAFRDQHSKVSGDSTYPFSSKDPFATRILHNAFPAISRYVVLTPLMALSYLQRMDYTKSLAFMMSGDSRNIFRVVMRTRVTSSYSSLRGTFQNGGFGETLTSSISAMNGTTGFPRVADLVAMRSTYVIVFCLILASISVLFTAKSDKWIPLVTPLRDMTILAISVMVLISPYPFAEILRSGFFSFFVALGFLTTAIAFLVPDRIQRPAVLLVACLAVLVTYLSYQPAALIVIPLCYVLSIMFLWELYKSRTSHVLISLAIFATILSCYWLYGSIYDRLVIRVGVSGEIWPTDAKFTLLALSTSCFLTLISKGNFRRTVLTASTLGVSAMLSLKLLDFARGSDPDMYYLMKFRYATNFVSGIILIAVIAAIFKEAAIWDRLNLPKSLYRKGSKVLRVVALLGLVGGLFVSISDHTQATSPISLIRSGWDAPSVLAAKKTFDLWKDDTPYIFSGYFNEENDRIANFWSPYFWEPNRWEWTYGGYSVSAEGLCNVIGTNDVNVLTKTFGLRRQMDLSCPTVSEHTQIQSPENHTYDFFGQNNG